MLFRSARHGYRISPGSFYPLLEKLEKKGYLRSIEERDGKSLRKVYRATRQGQAALIAAKDKVRELFGELFERSISNQRRATQNRTSAAIQKKQIC